LSDADQRARAWRLHARGHNGEWRLRRSQSNLIADSALEDREVQVSRTAPISAIPVRSPSHGSQGATGPAGDRLLAGWLVVPAYAAFGTKRPPVQIRPPRQGNGRSQGISRPAVWVMRSRVSDFGSPLGATAVRRVVRQPVACPSSGTSERRGQAGRLTKRGVEVSGIKRSRCVKHQAGPHSLGTRVSRYARAVTTDPKNGDQLSARQRTLAHCGPVRVCGSGRGQAA
jgi:hypothetical protein